MIQASEEVIEFYYETTDCSGQAFLDPAESLPTGATFLPLVEGADPTTNMVYYPMNAPLLNTS